MPQSPHSSQLFSRTLQHPVLGPLVEWVPTSWLLALSNPHPSDTTDLGTWNPDDPQVELAALWENLLSEGMRDPLIVGVGRVSSYVRLEAGNHRVRLLQQHGVFWVPAVAYVGDSSITHLGNGSHEGQQIDLCIPLATNILGPYPIKTYEKLSTVLRVMPT